MRDGCKPDMGTVARSRQSLFRAHVLRAAEPDVAVATLRITGETVTEIASQVIMAHIEHMVAAARDALA